MGKLKHVSQGCRVNSEVGRGLEPITRSDSALAQEVSMEDGPRCNGLWPENQKFNSWSSPRSCCVALGKCSPSLGLNPRGTETGLPPHSLASFLLPSVKPSPQLAISWLLSSSQTLQVAKGHELPSAPQCHTPCPVCQMTLFRPSQAQCPIHSKDSSGQGCSILAENRLVAPGPLLVPHILHTPSP